MTLSAADATRAPRSRTPTSADALHGHQVAITLVLLALLGGGVPARLHRGDRHRGRAGRRLPRAQRRRDRRSALWHDRRAPAPWSPTGRAALTTQHGNPLMMVGGVAAGLPQAGAGHVRLRDRRRGDAARAAATPTDTEARPAGRIRGTKRLLTTAAVIMSVFLVTSSLRHHAADPAGGVRARRPGQRAGAGLPGARVPRQRLRHDVRRLARSRSCGSPAPRRWPGMLNLIPRYLPALRHGAGVGRRGPPAGAGPHRRRRS